MRTQRTPSARVRIMVIIAAYKEEDELSVGLACGRACEAAAQASHLPGRLNMAAFIQRTQQEGEKGELSAHTARSGGRGLTQHAKGR